MGGAHISDLQVLFFCWSNSRKMATSGLRVNTSAADNVAGADGKDNMTPSTKLRHKYDVNSPRTGNTMTYPDNLMTQVQRPDDTAEAAESEGRCKSCAACIRRMLCCMFSKPAPQSQGTEVVNMPSNPQQPKGPGLVDPPAPEPESSSESDEPEGLLGPKDPKFKGKKCLILDLDETLVHSSFKPVADADFIVPIEIEGNTYKVYVLKRPFVDEFLREVAKHYEVVVFTASLSVYANPLLDILDKDQVVSHRLFRESCVLHGQAYVKDLSKIGRKMREMIIVDNSPLSYAFQPTSAIPISSWFDDRSDRELRELLPVLRTTLKDQKDVRDILDANNKSYKWLCNQAREE